MIALELMFVLGLVVVFLFCVWAVVYTGVWARKHGRRPFVWRAVVGFIIYLLFAWDQVPTLLVSEYYCATKAGLRVYESPNQWIADNPGVELNLVWKEGGRIENISANEKIEELNQRLILKSSVSRSSYLPVGLVVMSVVDRKDSKILMEHVTVSSGYGMWANLDDWRKLKIWVSGRVCGDSFGKALSLKEQYKKIGREG